MAQSKEPPAMSTTDSLNELSKMKAVFRAVEHCEEVMLAVQRAEGRKAELEKENADLEEQVKTARANRDKTVAAMNERQKYFDGYEKGLDAKKEEAKAKFDADMAQLSEHYSLASVAARDKVAEEIKAEQAKVDELTAKKSDLQRDVRMLQAEVEALKRSARPPAGAV